MRRKSTRVLVRVTAIGVIVASLYGCSGVPMGTTRYALCGKPGLGIAMWLSDLCAFPPLFGPAPIDLTKGGTTVSRNFKVRVPLSYTLYLRAVFPSVQARFSNSVIGHGYSSICYAKKLPQSMPNSEARELGRQIPFKVVLRNASTGAVIIDKTYRSWCVDAGIGKEEERDFAHFHLKPGNYAIKVINLKAQTGVSGVRFSLFLVPPREFG